MSNQAANTPKVLPPFSEEEYLTVFSRSVHFSFKAVNANAMEGGVRLSKKQTFKAPYLCAQTLQQQGYEIECDYAKQEKMPPSATVFKHYRIAREGDAKEAVESPSGVIDAYEKGTQDHFELNTDKLSPRLRQIILPANEEMEEYFVTTPLPAAGLHKLINAEVNASNQKTKEMRESESAFIGRSYMRFGGANPQNAGSLIRNHMRDFLLFDAPTESAESKKALALFYRGMDVRLSKTIMSKYRDWRCEVVEKYGSAQGNRRNKDIEEAYIQRLAHVLLKEANVLSRHLQASEDLLPPSKSLVSDELSALQRGLLDPSYRSFAWAREASAYIAMEIAQFKFSDNTTLGLSGSAINAIADTVEEVLR